MMTKRRFSEKYNILKIAGVLLVVIAILWCAIGIKANASEKAENDKTEYQLQEAQLKSEIRAGLEDMGYDNAGITMTKVMNADGSREYTVLVHHQYLDADDMNKVNAVYNMLGSIDMADNNMTVNYTIF